MTVEQKNNREFHIIESDEEKKERIARERAIHLDPKRHVVVMYPDFPGTDL